MRLSSYFLPTLKDNPADAVVVSHQLMVRAGMIRQVTAGIYNWLPLGLKVLQKVEAIVRSEMNKAGAQEILMPVLNPAELWQETGRWDKYEEGLMFRIKDRHGRDYLLGPTHEETVTDIYRNNVQSYKQLPVMLYQIQTKFRDETRPRFGLMRGREFMMKDCYSFDTDRDSALVSYETMRKAYHAIFSRLGLDFRQVLADTGDIGGNYSHEFHVLADSGEDDLLFDPNGEYAVNVEKFDANECPCDEDDLQKKKGIEVGHIFLLEEIYSKPMKAMVSHSDGSQKPVVMGCYGIGVSRVVAAAIEQNHDEHGIVWPKAMAPFDVGIINMRHDDSACNEAVSALESALEAKGLECLIDDRNEGAGKKFADMDLIGLPWQAVIGPRGLKEGKVEWKNRSTGSKFELPLGEFPEDLMA